MFTKTFTKAPKGGKSAGSDGNRNVTALGFVSMLNDIASEMVYPIVPIFLTSYLGASAAIVGIIEGIAEGSASILKLVSGWLSDRTRNRKRFVAAGYTLSALSKIILSLAASWTTVLAARFIDRFGKGVRTSARDALIADSTTPEKRGAAFGLHRGLDTFGAVLGPLIAVLLLSRLGNDFTAIFLIASVPAFIGVLLLLLRVREPSHSTTAKKLNLTFSLRSTGKQFRLFLLVNVIFALGNSADAFLLLRSQSLGVATAVTVMMYVSFNLSYSLLAYPFGRLFDKFGAKPIISSSFLLFALVYCGFGAASQSAHLWLLFPLYGLYMAMSEGVSKAYVSKLVPEENRGTSIGLFHAFTSIATLLSSIMAGLLWNYAGIPSPFYFGAILSLTAWVIFHKYF